MIYLQYYDKSIDIPEINTDKIISVISSLSNSAAGYDEMPASIMKQLVSYFVLPLTFLVNKSIAQGTVPDELKIAKMLPIYKNEVLPFFSKIFEKIVASYIIDFLEENNLFYCNQFELRKSHGTNHAIFDYISRQGLKSPRHRKICNWSIFGS